MLLEKIKTLPNKPGVYFFQGKNKQVLYIGKAQDLRKRVSQYFSSSNTLSFKTRKLVNNIIDIDIIITDSNDEALLLENTLIKKHKPRFNVRLKDDKTYPYIKIDLKENFPLVYITRQILPDNGRYFGPYTNVGGVRKTLRLLNKLFPFRSCTKKITGKDPHPCLEFHINRCAGPCIGVINQKEYMEIIKDITNFLEGNTKEVLNSLNERMHSASNQLHFENAAKYRDQIHAIKSVTEKQKVLFKNPLNMDVIGFWSSKSSKATFEILFIRNGRLIGKDNFTLTKITEDESDSELISIFLKQFYSNNKVIPSLILVSALPNEVNEITKWLTLLKKSNVEIKNPQRGHKAHLLKMAITNAEHKSSRSKIESNAIKTHLSDNLMSLLELPHSPHRIECYDISNLQGTNAVGSMVVFNDGIPVKKDYRKFGIKSVEGIDDYSMMQEVLTRRLQHLIESKKSNSPIQDSLHIKPDLIILDGGKGHLSIGHQVLLNLGIRDIPLASIAKKNEEIFVPHFQESIIIPKDSPTLYMLQNIRDEAHRFAITFHRTKRSKVGLKSVLDEIHGIGTKRRKALIEKFNDINSIKEASPTEISNTEGISLSLANMIKEKLNNSNPY